ncbi:VOC family protein [Embleya scabrispora]|uniref:VOC family protein n=1 Tax=Embleya scabrispora TaxID=159449 RepID=UPI00038182AC|nr:VOC family protein [Embleya scabrispora]MYS83695.1 glyoxalase [Streptomyces sp. SID5474]
MSDKALVSDLVPTLRYNDATAAITFLENAFGMSAVLVVPGDDDTVAHAELAFGNGMIMLGTNLPEGCGDQLRWPVGGSAVYGIVDGDVDAHCARAVAAGATVVREPKDEDYGGRGYTVRDPEGNLWSFGTYRPQV